MAKANQAKLEKAVKQSGSVDLTATQFSKKLLALATAAQQKKIAGYFKSGEGEYAHGDVFAGIPMGKVFALSREYTDVAPSEIEQLLESPIHEVRVGAVSIMDFQARKNSTTAERKKELFEIYIKKHNRINNWDLVDRSAPYVVGGYLANRSRQILYKLARSKNIWERRTAIVSTYFFIRQGDTNDTFKIAEILVNDKEDLIHKAVGGWIREAGKKDLPALLHFLDKHAATMPRTALRYAIEHLGANEKKYYMDLKVAKK